MSAYTAAVFNCADCKSGSGIVGYIVICETGTVSVAELELRLWPDPGSFVYKVAFVIRTLLPEFVE